MLSTNIHVFHLNTTSPILISQYVQLILCPEGIIFITHAFSVILAGETPFGRVLLNGFHSGFRKAILKPCWMVLEDGIVVKKRPPEFQYIFPCIGLNESPAHGGIEIKIAENLKRVHLHVKNNVISRNTISVCVTST